MLRGRALVQRGVEVARRAVERRHEAAACRASWQRSVWTGSCVGAGRGNSEGDGQAVAGADVRVTPRQEDYAQWYHDVIAASEMTDSSPVRGCMVMRPHGFAVWDAIKTQLDDAIKATGHTNAYFPLLIPQSFLSREASHVEGFAKECAVVTHHRLRVRPGASIDTDGEEHLLEPDPASKLHEPLVVRPTSEALIWHMYGRWIQSYRDLPVLMNQWANVFRWEMRTRPFLRTSEFLWQEGHTAHATRDEAVEEAHRMLDVYADLCHNVLAMPVIRGAKSARERFAGAEDTLTIEAMMQNGWALQAGTSHFLGQNFAKAFDVTYATATGGREHVWATSWGVSTRLVGGLIMSHSDDTGLVLPPALAPVQVDIVPITRKNKPDEGREVLEAAKRLCQGLNASGVRAKVDDRTHMTPGARFFESERKGTPLRIELGARDLASGLATLKTRIGEDRFTLTMDETLPTRVQETLSTVQSTLFSCAQQRMRDMTHRVTAYSDMKDALAASSLGQDAESPAGFFLAPWHDDADAEAQVQADCKATLRCFPFDAQPDAVGQTCFFSGKPATHMAIFARAY